MGTDIHGWVEYKDAELDEVLEEVRWWPVIVAGLLVNRNYSIFGPLFGVRNYSDFVPVAASRGLPSDVCDDIKREATDAVEHSLHSHTWVTWAELKAVDWDETALSGYVDVYRPGEDQPWMAEVLDRSDERRVDGATWIEGDLTYQVTKATRREAIDSGWKLLFDMMEVLAKRFGNDCVRLVVWFDNFS